MRWLVVALVVVGYIWMVSLIGHCIQYFMHDRGGDRD